MNNVFTRLKPSEIQGAGVGVFSICDIPKGINPFGDSDIKLRIMSMTEFQELSEDKKKIVQDFCYHSRGNWHVPIDFNKLDIGWYVNSSTEPNLSFDTQTGNYISLRDIKKGEELTYNYIIYE
jgi:uncharacterized protein